MIGSEGGCRQRRMEGERKVAYADGRKGNELKEGAGGGWGSVSCAEEGEEEGEEEIVKGRICLLLYGRNCTLRNPCFSSQSRHEGGRLGGCAGGEGGVGKGGKY